MRSIKIIMGMALLSLMWACSDNDKQQQCDCKTDAESIELTDKTAKVSWNDEIGMYFLSEYVEGEQLIDGHHIYMVDREQDIENIRSLNSDDIIFSGSAIKSTYLPNPHVGGNDYYCITLSNVRNK